MRYSISPVTRTGLVEAVALGEAKTHVDQDHDVHDDLIEDLVVAAAETIEDVQERVLRKGTLVLRLPCWPASGMIEIPRWPLISVESVTYLTEGATDPTVLAADSWTVLANRKPPAVVLKKGVSWPTASLEYGEPITVSFTAGYEDGAVPQKVRGSLKRIVARWYEQRGEGFGAQIPDEELQFLLAERLW